MDLQSFPHWFGTIRSWPWAEIKSIAELVLYYLTVLAVLGCLLRLGAIGRILRDFREARGPLWELQNTVTHLRELEPAMRDLGAQVALIDGKVDAARRQVTELQAENMSMRSDAGDEGVDATNDGTELDQLAVKAEDMNWIKLREVWQRNRKRIEYAIDQIKDGRTKLAYDRIPRTSYKRILNKLQGQRFISAAAANASRDLIDLFNKYRPRNRTIPDEVIGALRVLDDLLDRELVPYAVVLAAENNDQQPPAAASAPSPLVAGIRLPSVDAEYRAV